MRQVAEERDLYKACRIIFGPDLTFSRDFLDYIQMQGIKSAFRKRAMENHPDRAAFQADGEKGHQEDQFRVIKDAYDTLCAYLIVRDREYRLPGKLKRSRTASPGGARYHRSGEKHCQGEYNRQQAGKSQRPGKGKFRSSGMQRGGAFASGYAGKQEQRHSRPDKKEIPERRLLFGHYLYYMGVIDWHCLVKALVWQRRQRYRIGELARKKGWLSSRDIQILLKESQPRQTFGQKARAWGLLTDKQVAHLLCQQRKEQRKIGEYLLEQNILNRKQLAELLLSFHRHNAVYERRPSS
ncbi:MAG: DnaJ domain-containing protein [Desulfurivibrionaceae bacterium]